MAAKTRARIPVRALFWSFFFINFHKNVMHRFNFCGWLRRGPALPDRSFIFSVLAKFVQRIITESQCGRVVKACDLKSHGNFPRRFKSCRWRSTLSVAQLEERRTVNVPQQSSLGRWFESCRWDYFFVWVFKLNQNMTRLVLKRESPTAIWVCHHFTQISLKVSTLSHVDKPVFFSFWKFY